MSVRSIIVSQFETVAGENDLKLPSLNDDLVLLESGLNSLSFAIIVARLEDQLGYDPFSTNEDLQMPVTLRDFIRIYEDHAA